MVLLVNRKIYRLTDRPILVLAPAIIRRLISSDRALDSPKNTKPRTAHRKTQAQQGTNPDPLPNSNPIAPKTTAPASRKLHPHRHPPISKTYVFSLNRQAFLTDDLKTPI